MKDTSYEVEFLKYLARKMEVGSLWHQKTFQLVKKKVVSIPTILQLKTAAWKSMFIGQEVTSLGLLLITIVTR